MLILQKHSFFMQTQSDFNFEDFKKEAIKGMYAGKPLNGEKGIFAPLLKHFLEAALAGEMDSHLQESKQQGERNRRNGKAIKRVKSLSGEFDLETSRDRTGTFEPLILPKRQIIITEELEDKVIALYGRGVSTRDISDYIKEMYRGRPVRWIFLRLNYHPLPTRLFQPSMSGEPDPYNQFMPLSIWTVCITK
jgi:putative transposase